MFSLKDEFDFIINYFHLKNEAGINAFVLPPQTWVEKTNTIGIVSKSGRYDGIVNVS